MPRIEHFALFAADPDALKRFYVESFGLSVAVDNSASSPPGYFLADDHGAALEIIGRPVDQSPAGQRYICHVAFHVENFAAARSALERRGCEFEADTEVANERMQTAFFNDPEGNRAQIVWRAHPLTK